MAYSEEQKEEIFNNIFNSIENGNSLRKTLLVIDLPAKTFYEWLEQDEEKSKQYDKIKESEIYQNNIKCNSNPKGSKAQEIDDYRVLNARLVNKKRFPKSNIYIIKLQNFNLYKIGVSNNFNRRYKDINNALPFKCEIILNECVNNAYDLEELIHFSLKEKHVKNEWFDLSDISLIIKTIKKWQEDQ